jgi:hypothetical protein
MRKIYVITAAAAVTVCLMNVARVDRNNLPVDPAASIEAQTRMPQNVSAILHRACQDCHSEQTRWPWYSKVAPFEWLMAADVYGARDHLNLSRWGRYTEDEKTGRLAAVCEMVAGGKVPLWYYKPAHYPEAWLTASDRKAVCDWVKAEVVAAAR